MRAKCDSLLFTPISHLTRFLDTARTSELILIFYVKREIEISNLVARGFTNEQIGERLDISEPTVKTHSRNIYSKTDIHDRANLVIRVLNSDKV